VAELLSIYNDTNMIWVAKIGGIKKGNTCHANSTKKILFNPMCMKRLHPPPSPKYGTCNETNKTTGSFIETFGFQETFGGNKSRCRVNWE